jgi:RNA polymerase sigma-70 factor (ECF subfamily)
MPRLPQDQFTALVREHHAAVYRSAARLCGDDATAADVAQEVFVRVLEGKQHLAAARSVRATLCWLAARLAANALRARRRRRDHEDHAMHPNPAADERSDPARLCADADLHAAVAGLLGEMPDDLRVPLLMRCQDDLTLAAIGGALRLSTSTVHDRVEAGLQRLRDGLQRRGHTVGTPAVLGLVGRGEPVVVPSGFEARLLALGSHAAPVVVGIGRRLVGALLVAAGLAGAWVAAATWPERAPAAVPVAALGGVVADRVQDPPPPVRENATPVPPPLRSAAVSLPPAPSAVAPAERFTLRGTVHDAAGWSVAGAEVYVVAGGGLKAFALGAVTTTDAAGAFVVEGQPAFVHPGAVRVVVREHGRTLLTTGDLTLPLAAPAEPLRLVLPASVGSATARYEATVAVRDAGGAPLVGLDVRLYDDVEPRPRPGWDGGAAHAETGDDGRAVLRGRGLGRRWLFVDGRARGLRSAMLPFDVVPGASTTEVVLAPGNEILVDARGVDGEQLPDVHVAVTEETTRLEHTGARASALWRCGGLGDGPCTVTVRARDRSPAQRRGVRPGTTPLVLRLKRADDRRDVGDHMAELRGTLVDAATGEVLSFGPFCVELLPALVGTSTLPTDRIEPPLPVQTMSMGEVYHDFCEQGLAAGSWVLLVERADYAITAVVVDLREGELRHDLRIALPRPATVRGRVLAPDGRPVAGAQVFVVGQGPLADRHLAAWRDHQVRTHPPGAREPSHVPIRAWTREDGSFALGKLPPDVELRLVARHDEAGFVVQPLGVLRSGDALEGRELRLEPR